MSSYSQIIAEIEELTRQAEKKRKEESRSVLKTLRQQISDYGFTAAELGFEASSGVSKGAGKKSRSTVGKKARSSKAKARSLTRKVSPKYRDDQGNTWTGRGKKPLWVVQALSQGRTLESLLIPMNE